MAWLLAPLARHAPDPRHSVGAHLEDNVAAADIELTDDEMAVLEAAA